MIPFLNHNEGCVRLTFHESNILIENLREQDHQGFIARLDNLLRNTQDPRLLAELEQLLSKLRDLTPGEYEQLRKDTIAGTVLFPPDYFLPGRAGETPL